MGNPNRAVTTHGHHGHHAPQSRKELAGMSLGALGVVYGDIGTSPLYAIRECTGEHGVAPTPENILGILSLVFWALVLVICIKYLIFVLRADNKGEGGILALAALVAGPDGTRGKRILLPVLLALIGAGLLFGEGIITPAISVLGAVEGLGVATTALDPLIVPITAGILVALFLVQRFGTHRIGSVFGWVMFVWFLSIAAAGLPAIIRTPHVLAAINPWHAVEFFRHNGYGGFLILGSVVLVITGGEALYADMGHFGKTPIRLAWFSVVLPCVLMSYFGQGALVLEHAPERIDNTFFALVEGPMLYPMVVIATMAAVVASQALISGVFSLTRQAMLLGFSPRVTVKHTSAELEGQIYIPEINWLLMVGCVTLVLGFQSSSALAAAYGIAVTGTMAITSFLYSRVAIRNFHWSTTRATIFLVFFITIDLTFFSANLHKISSGGWLPLVTGTGILIIATTWWRGRVELSRAIGEATLPVELFLADIAETKLHRVPGTAVFMASNVDGIPQVLLHHVKHNKVLHKQVVLLSIQTEGMPFVPGNDSLELNELGQGFYQVRARVGFMQEPRVPRILQRCSDRGLDYNPGDTTYYLGRQTLLTTGKAHMARWRKTLFSFLTRNSRPPTSFFDLPPNRVVELGMQIEL
ncbi:MAG: potassium transporter Kup [Myxococcales bacterium]|nr:potassium transporter Kup [Myxococcales bacterium]